MSSLAFDFTPVDAPGPRTGANPHAKATTHCPEAVAALQEHFGADVLEVIEYAGEHSVVVERRRIVEVAAFLKDEHDFNYLVDLGAADRFTETDRFEVFYNFVSINSKKRLRIKIRVDEDNAVVPTLSKLFASANWYEREAWDMMGIRFEGHEDLRRMYMPEDFEYFPQRKEFPLLGIPGSLPLPPQTPNGNLNLDPFAAAHGSRSIKSYEEDELSPEDDTRS
jgi:NADH-quinone oxidoreductase subunit C